MDKLEEIKFIISNNEIEKVERLLELSNDNDEEVRFRAIGALYPFSDKKGVFDRVRDAIKDSDSLVRVESIGLLGDWQDVSSVLQIIESLSDDDWLVRASAAISLGKIGDKKAISAIEAKLESVSYDEELLRYYIALSCLGKNQYLRKVLDQLSNPYYRVRCAVANLLLECLEYLDSENFVEDFKKALEKALEKEETKAARSSIVNAIQNI